MRPPTNNAVSQEVHGSYNAVDYRSVPDPIIYAPEDLTYYVYLPNAGDAGNNLQATGAHGRHGFCHLEESYLKPGQSVRKGTPIGKMGYTGRTIPSGPTGRHLHWVLLRNGVYVYPPTLVTEPFGGSQQGENTVVLTEEAVRTLYRKLFNREGDPGGVKNYTGKTLDFALSDMLGSQEFRNIHVKTVEKVVERIVEKPVEIIKEVPGGQSQASEMDKADAQSWRNWKNLHKELNR